MDVLMPHRERVAGSAFRPSPSYVLQPRCFLYTLWSSKPLVTTGCNISVSFGIESDGGHSIWDSAPNVHLLPGPGRFEFSIPGAHEIAPRFVFRFHVIDALRPQRERPAGADHRIVQIERPDPANS